MASCMNEGGVEAVSKMSQPGEAKEEASSGWTEWLKSCGKRVEKRMGGGGIGQVSRLRRSTGGGGDCGRREIVETSKGG